MDARQPLGPDATAERETPRHSERGRLLESISNALVRLHKTYYGKGPTKARSYLVGKIIFVVLEGGYTRAEQTLIERGQEGQVIQTRLALQESMEREARAAVETIVVRGVQSFMSANDPRQNLQVEVFVLEDAERDQRSGPDALTEHTRAVRERHEQLLDEHRALRAEQRQARRAHQSKRQGL